MKTRGFWTEFACLYGSKNSPVIFCMQKSMPSIRNTSLHGTQPSRVVFGCKTVTYEPEKQVSMGPRYDLSFCACNTAWLAPEILVSMGPNPYLWLLHAKQRLLGQNYKYLCVPALICGFCIHNSAFWTRISSLYGSQTSFVVLSTHNCVLNTRI